MQWRGIRGGTREIAYRQADTFALTVEIDNMFKTWESLAKYYIQVKPISASGQPEIVRELLYKGAENKLDYQNKFDNQGNWEHPHLYSHAFPSMRFLDFNPEVMRQPSIPGQKIIGDRGENLSSVLQTICEDTERKQVLIQWLQELTPMDVSDFEFVPDQTGKVLVNFIEEDGQRTTAYSASDGTLRFLGIITALLTPEPAAFYFLEELDTGLHPSRLHLLLQLIEQEVAKGKFQMVITTHSPQLLRFLSKESLEYVSLLYRLPGAPDARIKRILDIPDAKRVIEEHDIAELHDSGWFENALFFDEGEAS